jgi:hypothetical protein
MRSALIVVLVYSLLSFPAQTDLWEKVEGYRPLHLKTYAASPAELVRIKKALVARVGLDNWPCAEEDGSGVDRESQVRRTASICDGESSAG